MIGIKPVLHVDDEGKLVPLAKVRGRKQSLQALVDRMEQQIGSYRDSKQRIFISHGDCEEDARYVAELVKQRFGYEDFMISFIDLAGSPMRSGEQRFSGRKTLDTAGFCL